MMLLFIQSIIVYGLIIWVMTYFGNIAYRKQYPQGFGGIDMFQNRKISFITLFTRTYFVSQSTLCRMFRKHLQTTPRLYLESKRLAHSRRLLREGKSVLDACYESGFSDYSNYIRLFKRRFSVTPGQYRSGDVWQE